MNNLFIFTISIIVSFILIPIYVWSEIKRGLND